MFSDLGEPTSHDMSSIAALGEDFVLASGAEGWKDVVDNYTGDSGTEPVGFICERGIYSYYFNGRKISMHRLG